jgi:hypothetical protein
MNSKHNIQNTAIKDATATNTEKIQQQKEKLNMLFNNAVNFSGEECLLMRTNVKMVLKSLN